VRKLNLLSMLKIGPPVIFLGAGATCDSGLPQGDAAAEAVVRGLFEVTSPEDLYPSVRWPRFEAVMERLDESVADAATAIISAFAGIGLAAVPQMLASISEPPWLWITTNFDDQIERALGSHSKRFRVIVKRSEISAHSCAVEDSQVIIKLHGDASLAADLGVTMRQILRAIPESATNAIDKFVCSRPLIVIGYSARDPDLTSLLKRICAHAAVVAWLDLGKEPAERVKLLLNDRAGDSYYPGEAGSLLAEELGIERLRPQETSEWIGRVQEWLRKQGTQELALALAAICLDQGGSICHDITPRVLEKVSDHGPHLPRKAVIQIRHLIKLGNPGLEPGKRAQWLQEAAESELLDMDTRLRCLHAASLAFHAVGQYDEEERALRKALDLLQLVHQFHPALKADILCQLGIALSYRGRLSDVDACTKILEEAVRASDLAGDAILSLHAKRRLPCT